MTPHPLIAAAHALADLLARENAALAALDHAGATAVVEAKRRATEAFATVHAQLAAAGGALPAELRQAGQAVAITLRDLAAENRRLLERAMTVQGRVIGVIAQAAPRVATQAPRYGRSGALEDARKVLPMALSASV